MKRCLIFCMVFFSVHAPMRAEENVVIEEAFVTFASANYFPLLKVLLDSVKAFSTRPIVAFGINDDIPFSTEEYPFLIKRRLDVDLSTHRHTIYWQKPRIIFESGVRYGVYVEADDILNDGVDTLFDWARSVGNYPLCPYHPEKPWENVRALMGALKIRDKSMPYVHGHVVFSENCKDFIKNWYDHCLSHGDWAPNADETVLNALLWKEGATKQLEVYDPYFGQIEDYKRYHQQQSFPANMKYFMFHGCKDVRRAKEILNILRVLSHKQ